MGFMNKFGKLLGIPEEEYQEDVQITMGEGGNQYASEQSGGYAADDRNASKVVNIHTTTQLQVVMSKPERFDDAADVADHLNSKRTVVLNLEHTNKDVSRRLIDFLSGVAYANRGTIKRVASSTYIITPENVGIMGDLLDELESNGVIF